MERRSRNAFIIIVFINTVMANLVHPASLSFIFIYLFIYLFIFFGAAASTEKMTFFDC